MREWFACPVATQEPSHSVPQFPMRVVDTDVHAAPQGYTAPGEAPLDVGKEVPLHKVAGSHTPRQVWD